MFFASQNAPGRAALVTAFHHDAQSVFPSSVVFRHGNYMVGVKLRNLDPDHLRLIINGVADAWKTWSQLVRRNPDGLNWHLDGTM